MLVHLTDLDEYEHEYGPFSPEADRSLEVIDGEIGQIRTAALAANPGTRIAIVSDHGFLPVQKRTNLNVLLAQVGLITLGPPKGKDHRPTVLSWRAEAWAAGGSNAIVLHDPANKAVEAQVQSVLTKAAAEPNDGIATILTHQEVVQRGGFPQASFLVDYKQGWDAGTAYTGPVVTSAPVKGMHGYLPTNREMRSAFLIEGRGIAQGKDLGVVDMRRIAPTLARLLGVSIPEAKQRPLPVH